MKTSSQPVYINARFLTQQITGVQQFALEVCYNLDPTVTLVAPKGTMLPDSLKHHKLVAVGSGSGYFWEQVELPLYLKSQGNPLLINFCNTAPLFYTNQFVTIHDLAFMHHPEWFSKAFARVYRFLIPRIARKSRLTLTVSKTVARQIHETLRVPENRIEIIPNGIYHELNTGDIPLAERKKQILTVSSINPRKNLRFLENAFLAANLPDYELIIVGARNAVFANEETISANRIRYVGYIDNAALRQLYAESALFVSLSLDEGFGIPVLEALFCGCPVLLSDIPVYRECFGSMATFTSPWDVQKAAADLRHCLYTSAPISNMTQLLETYNYAHSAKKITQLIEDASKKM